MNIWDKDTGEFVGVEDGKLKVAATLYGSIPEYSWFDGDTEPTPTEEFAFGVKFNTSTGAITVYGWSGTAWVGVV